MTAVYLIFTVLSLFNCMLPAGVFSMIWEQISSNMTVGVPYIAIIRVLIASGIILAVVLSDRIRAYVMIRDIVIGSTALEALALLGFSLSRVFWNLCLWAFCLGLGMGLGVSLLCRMLRRAGNRFAEIVFAGGACGIMAGVWILDQVFRRGGNWRTSCQILAVTQVLLCLIQFSLRRRRLRDSEETVHRLQRERNRRRSDRRQEMIRRDGAVDERSAPHYYLRLLCCYLACTFCSILILGAVLWPEAYLVSSAGTAISSFKAVMLVTGGLAAGRILSAMLPWPARIKCILSGILSVAVTVAAALLMHAGRSVLLMEAFQFAVGFAAGPLFPNMDLLEDERLDEDAQDSLFGMLSAFYFGGWAVITPLTQALVGSSQERYFAWWMLLAAVLMTICTAGGAKRFRRE